MIVRCCAGTILWYNGPDDVISSSWGNQVVKSGGILWTEAQYIPGPTGKLEATFKMAKNCQQRGARSYFKT